VTEPQHQSGVLVIGYGNTLRCDDGAGVVAAQQLAARVGNQAAVITAHQLLPEMACEIACFDTVIFMDASVDLPGGVVASAAVNPSAAEAGPTGHHLTPAALLAMTDSMFGRAARGHIIAVGAESLELGESLSPAVTVAVDEMVDRAIGLIESRVPVHA
jgi:hydrogenase maturation protease